MAIRARYYGFRATSFSFHGVLNGPASGIPIKPCVFGKITEWRIRGRLAPHRAVDSFSGSRAWPGGTLSIVQGRDETPDQDDFWLDSG